jgi:hypothetical protein
MEYWRFYQSGQFLHLAAVREVLESEWRAQLVRAARWHHSDPPQGTWDEVPGFFSMLNFLYTITEVFEFAARVAQRGIYVGPVLVDISLHDVRGFVLVPEVDRAWSEYCSASEAELTRTWTVASADLIANSAAASLEATVWFFERLGWLKPNTEVLRRDQEKFLKGLL